MKVATNGQKEYKVKYDIPGKDKYMETVVQKVKNGISANSPEACMRRQDPETAEQSVRPYDNLTTFRHEGASGGGKSELHQHIVRKDLPRRGAARFREDQYKEARCPLLGYELKHLTIESSKIPSSFLKVYNQPEVGMEGYDAGTELLKSFFKKERQKYLTPDLHPTGRKIIEACLNGASVEMYNKIVPMSFKYGYSYNKI